MTTEQHISHRGVWDGVGQEDSEWVSGGWHFGNNSDWCEYKDQYGNTHTEYDQHNDHDKMEDHWYENGGEYWSGYYS